MSNKIFISHAARDERIVAAFEELLHMGMDIRKSEIFCTSKAGSVAVGEEFMERIRKEIKDCEEVIFLISPAYMESFMCHIEWGAAWALGKNIKPIVVPPLTFSDLKKPIDERQAIMILDDKGIGALYDDLRAAKVAASRTDDFVEARAKFMEQIKKILSESGKWEEEGTLEVEIMEIYIGEKGKFYRIRDKVDKEVLQKKAGKHLESWEREGHWLQTNSGKLDGVRVGDKVKIKVTGSKYYHRILHGEQVLQDVRNIYFMIWKQDSASCGSWK